MSAKVIALYCLSWWVWKVEATIYDDNITDFTKCQTYISRSEGKYSRFYEINKDEKPENDSLVFDFHFSVLARSDAHILLAESDVLLKTDPVYEIVIGAGSNTFSDLRKRQKSAGKVTARIKGLLSAIEIRSFWIHVWNDGLVEVGKETEELAFMAWRDPQPLNMQFFSFSTWPGVEAKWFFDCERKITKGSELILADKERLHHDLFQNYGIFTKPVLNESDIINIELSLLPQFISLDVGSSKLSIKGAGYMKWRDQKLKWNPEDYGDIKFLKLPSHQIWTPDLRLHDYQVKLEEAILYQNGSVFCNIHLDLTYWCNIKDLGSWPADVHNCSLSFHFTRDSDTIRLMYVNKREDFFRLSSGSEWTVVDLDIKQEQVTDESIDYTTDEPTKLTFFFTLKRTSNIYKLIFFTPFFVIGIFSLCTFCTSPFGYLKISLCCIQLIVESVILICISITIPGHSSTVPTLVNLYSDSLISTVVLVIISVIVINLARNEHKKYSMPDVLYYVLSSDILQGILLLPTTRNDSVYGNLSENPIRLQEDTEKSQWVLLGVIIDRICFIVYLIFFIILISRY